jgi:hypothetical protein
VNKFFATAASRSGESDSGAPASGDAGANGKNGDSGGNAGKEKQK